MAQKLIVMEDKIKIAGKLFVRKLSNFLIAPFFILHYGLFALVHGVFVCVFFMIAKFY